MSGPTSTEYFDVAIIGGGVVGCATARRFAMAGARVLLLEKGADILSGASKANSAILHTGFDAPVGSLELDLVRRGRAEYLEMHGTLGLHLVRTGAMVCAWTDAEAGLLDAIAEQGRENGVPDIDLLTAAEVRREVPALSPAIKSAVAVRGEHVIDPWSAPLGYLTQAMAMGAQVWRSCEVLGGRFETEWSLDTSNGPVRAGCVINAAGLFGDEVDRRLGVAPEFTIKPRKGQFIVLDKAAARFVPQILLPVPNEITKGIVICPTAFGNVLVGPTAEEQDDRTRATVDEATLVMLRNHVDRLVPDLRDIPVTATYAGLRPGSDKKHYRIAARPECRLITLGGIRSTGLSAALGLAGHALDLFASFGDVIVPVANVPQVRMPTLTETEPRDWQCDNHGEIVCHCEMVTAREIEATFASPLPPTDFGGLRRRTRAGMGRCQGFYCQGRLAAMTKGRFATPLATEGDT